MNKPLHNLIDSRRSQKISEGEGMYVKSMIFLSGLMFVWIFLAGCQSAPKPLQLPQSIYIGQGYEKKLSMSKAEAILVIEPFLKAMYPYRYATNYQSSTPVAEATIKVFKSIDENGYTLAERTCVTIGRSPVEPGGTVTILYRFENADVYYKFADVERIKYFVVRKDRDYLFVNLYTSRTLLPYAVSHEYPVTIKAILVDSEYSTDNQVNEKNARVPLCSSLDHLISALLTLCPNVK